MELLGPILPHAVQGLTSLLARTQAGEYTASYSVNDPTAPLNAGVLVEKQKDSCGREANESSPCSASADSVFSSSNQTPEVGGHSHSSKSSYADDSDVHIGKSAIKEMSCRQGRFTWTI